ncbi:pro-sigmaK processing inhibitor BofA family protein [Halorussus salinus]|uniref:pro-sigmaK processing inhibitor BofA family protein n=1 Tax=Halorussus salinus TaxID=1364935 RepID=UPI0010932DE9|nr:pro-sigmaK processing inhibitor BofA family protein [Halorussus salinus]
MVTGLELGLLFAVVVAVVAVYWLTKAVKALLVNAVVGLLALFVAQWLGIGVVVSPWVLLIVAIGGLPGALLVVALALLGIAFTPAFVSFAPALLPAL